MGNNASSSNKTSNSEAPGGGALRVISQSTPHTQYHSPPRRGSSGDENLADMQVRRSCSRVPRDK